LDDHLKDAEDERNLEVAAIFATKKKWAIEDLNL